MDGHKIIPRHISITRQFSNEYKKYKKWCKEKIGYYPEGTTNFDIYNFIEFMILTYKENNKNSDLIDGVEEHIWFKRLEVLEWCLEEWDYKSHPYKWAFKEYLKLLNPYEIIVEKLFEPNYGEKYYDKKPYNNEYI